MVPQRHYCIPPLSRINLDQVLELVADMRYFVVHGPRQTGKTSTLKALAETLNLTGNYRCVYANCEVARTAGQDVPRAMRALLDQLARRARRMVQDNFVQSTKARLLVDCGADSVLNEMLALWAESSTEPLVLLIDEIDTLVGDSLLLVLRQLRAGYDERPDGFPQSVILCGVRDVRDCRIRSSADGGETNTATAFNVKAKSLRLEHFTEGEVRALLGQHTAQTGQEFEKGAMEKIWKLTRGQPWLVNALALATCFEDRAELDRSRPVTKAAIETAREELILRRATHLDQLAAALSEDRVRRVIMPVLSGSVAWDWSPRDLEYVRDLGLVARNGPARMANPIYGGVVPRELSYGLQAGLESVVNPQCYVSADGGLDMRTLLTAFQGYFGDHSEFWIERYGHREAGPQLVLDAYLQRAVNGGGRIEREYGLGRHRTDLLVIWPLPGGGEERQVIVCKVGGTRRGVDSVIAEGVRQTAEYMDLAGSNSGHLVVFDLRESRPWSQRSFQRFETVDEVVVGVWGM